MTILILIGISFVAGVITGHRFRPVVNRRLRHVSRKLTKLAK